MDQSLVDSLRQIIREEVRPIIREEVRPIVREEVRHIAREEARSAIQDEVRPIVQKETEAMHSNIEVILQNQATQSSQLHTLQATVTSTQSTLRHHSQEIHRLDVLLEDLNDRFASARQLSWD